MVFTQHLREVNETYFQHFGMAIRFAGWMFVGALVCLVHAILPFVFERTGSRIVKNLNFRMVEARSAKATSEVPQHSEMQSS